MEEKQEMQYYRFYIHIMQDQNLDVEERLIYNLIYNFTDENGRVCYFTNEYIAKELALNLTQVKRSLRALLEKKYIMYVKSYSKKTLRNIMRYDSKIVSRAEKGHYKGLSSYYVYCK